MLSIYLLATFTAHFFFLLEKSIYLGTYLLLPSGISIYTLIYVITKKYYDSKYMLITKGQIMIIIFKNRYTCKQ